MWEVKPIMQELLAGAIMSTQKSRLPSATMKMDLEAFYNTKRIHSHCDYMCPNDYEELYRRLQQGELQMAG